ncbi:hypothetical protein JTB14_029832 [Gonioctena quinquepunctata]|nr:hypothetical protein JTB14_029832 [Gonioctena quinquepunctata]
MEYESYNESDESGDQNVDDFVDFTDSQDNQEAGSSSTMNEKGTEGTSESSNKTTNIQLELSRYLEDKRTNLQVLNQYPILKKVSLEYNTRLPSSAPVEILFSFATMMNTPKRKNVSDEHFEVFGADEGKFKCTIIDINITSSVTMW